MSEENPNLILSDSFDVANDNSIVSTIRAHSSGRSIEELKAILNEELQKTKTLQAEQEELTFINTEQQKEIDLGNIVFKDLSTIINSQMDNIEKYNYFINETNEASIACNKDMALCTEVDQEFERYLNTYKHSLDTDLLSTSQEIEESKKRIQLLEDQINNFDEKKLDFLRTKITKLKNEEAAIDLELISSQNDQNTINASLSIMKKDNEQFSFDIEQCTIENAKICAIITSHKENFDIAFTDVSNHIQKTTNCIKTIEEQIQKDTDDLKCLKDVELELNHELSSQIKLKNIAIENSSIERIDQLKGLNMIGKKSERFNLELGTAFIQLQDLQTKLGELKNPDHLLMEQNVQEELLKIENELKMLKGENDKSEEMEKEQDHLYLTKVEETDKIKKKCAELTRCLDENILKTKNVEYLRLVELNKFDEAMKESQTLTNVMTNDYETKIRTEKQEIENIKINSTTSAEETDNERTVSENLKKNDMDKLRKTQSEIRNRIANKKAYLESVLLEYEVLTRKIDEAITEIDAQETQLAEKQKELDQLILPPLPKPPISRKPDIGEESDSSLEGITLAQHVANIKARREKKKLAKKPK